MSRSKQPTGIFHLTILVPFTSLFWFNSPQFFCFISVSQLSPTSFQAAMGGCFILDALINPLYAGASNSQHFLKAWPRLFPNLNQEVIFNLNQDTSLAPSK